jgi:NAD(P)-dependent dehydrogenase (short-subunit alcohol dehydrogenase family)
LATFVQLDVTQEAGWAALVGQLASDPPDALVNNAGGLLDPRPLLEADLDTWRATLDLNLTSVFLGLRAVLPLMLERGRGSIVNVCSVSGVTGQTDAPGYQAAKAGVLMLTRNAALTYGPRGVRVNALTPSIVATPGLERETDERLDAFLGRVPLGRAAEAIEVARAARFLVSDDAAYVNGANLAVDGGYLA